MRLKITKTSIERDCHPPAPNELNSNGKAKTQKIYQDLTLKGFGIIVGKNSKTFFAQHDIRGKTVRVTIGRYGTWTVDQARRRAKELMVLMAGGENPNELSKIEETRSITFQEAVELFFCSPKERSDRTIIWYQEKLRNHFKDWLKKPLVDITRKEIHTRHQKIGKKSGHYAANGAMRTFRAIWKRAMKQHEELPVCPTINVDWFPEYKRNGIPLEKLEEWYIGIQNLSNPIRRDAYLFVLFTGLRSGSAGTIRWEDIDFEKETLFIPRPKGGEKRAFTLPLSNYALDILVRRKTENEPFFPESPWVFPALSKSGHIEEWKLPVSIRKTFPVPFQTHQLRHVFTTSANAAGLTPYDIKLLTNHSLPKSDVTGGYITTDIGVLRKANQRVTDYLLNIIGKKQKISANLISFPKNGPEKLSSMAKKEN